MNEFRQHVAAHHGVFSRREAREHGVTDNQLAGMLKRGEVVRTHPGVYRFATSPRTWESNMRSAVLSADGVVSHRGAAALWEIDGFPKALAEITISSDRCVVLPGIKVHRSTQYALRDATVIDGLPVTGVSRTVLDVAAVVGPRRLNQTVDAVLREQLVDWPDLYDVLIRHSARGRNGCGGLRKLLDARYGDTAIPDSRWNRMVGDLLIDAGLPEPEYEAEIRSSDGEFLARVDLLFRRQRVIIELDSVRWHMNQESFTADPRRKNRLLIDGWTVLTFTWDDYADRPGALVQTVRLALGVL